MSLPFHAVIQGPLTSPPTAGRKWPPDLDANCAASVLDSASAVAAENGTAVVSTWVGEDGAKCRQIAAHPAVATLIETPDPGKPPDTNGPVGDNRLRQGLSTLRGLEELERRGVTGLVAKIRTDQTVPLALVRRFASDFLGGLGEPARDRIVLTTSVHGTSMYEIDDFLFVGTLPAMKRFFEAQVRLAPFHSGTHSIHGDLVRKHLSWTVGPALGWPAWRCFPALPFTLPETAQPRIHPGTIGPWVDTLLDFIVPMPREVWLQMTWRGSPPFGQWADWSGLNEQFRLYFDHREELARRREDFFLQRWPKLFGTLGTGCVQRHLDYALEVPEEIRLGGATRRTVLMRRARRAVNRFRFRAPRRRGER
jgi:hypothetical protein